MRQNVELDLIIQQDVSQFNYKIEIILIYIFLYKTTYCFNYLSFHKKMSIHPDYAGLMCATIITTFIMCITAIYQPSMTCHLRAM
jgi:hypothetical protein